VSSTASNVSVTPAVAPSPWPQTPAATQDNAQDNGGGPFAALLDANTQPTPQPAAPRTSTATDQPAAKFAAHRNNGATGAAQTTTPGAQPPAGATKNANAAAPAVASSNATVNPSALQNATANQSGTAPTDITGGGTALNAFAGAAATIVTDATANAATTDATTKPSSDNQDDSGSDTDAGAAVATTATNVQAQPVAAAIVANAVINTPPAAVAAAMPDTVIGGSGKASAKPALPFVDAKDAASSQGVSDPSATSDAAPAAPDVKDAALTQDVKISAAGQDTEAAATAQDAKIAVAAQDAKVTTPTAKVAPAQGAKATVSGKQTPSTASSAPAANAASPADATDGQPWNGSSAPQMRTDGDTIMPAQSGSSAATHVDALATTPASDAGGSPSAQSGWNAAKAATEGLPNFGIVANQAAPTAAAAAPGTAAAATVPIAGLAVAIASRAQAGSSQFDIRLDPPELGRIDVRLDVDRDGQVTSHVTVDRAETLQLLQSQEPQLKHALEQAGLKTADNGLQFTLRDQSFAGQNGGNGGGAQPSAAQLVIPDVDQPVIQATQIYSRAGLGSGVDIRV
jgi:flagellar hook-length control protein FliK